MTPRTLSPRKTLSPDTRTFVPCPRPPTGPTAAASWLPLSESGVKPPHSTKRRLTFVSFGPLLCVRIYQGGLWPQPTCGPRHPPPTQPSPGGGGNSSLLPPGGGGGRAFSAPFESHHNRTFSRLWEIRLPLPLSRPLAPPTAKPNGRRSARRSSSTKKQGESPLFGVRGMFPLFGFDS